MSADEKSTDRGLSAVERKALRNREAREAMADHEEVVKASRANLERLRTERQAREAAEGPMLDPAPELPDDTPVERVRFSTRIRNAMKAGGLKTVGQIREARPELCHPLARTLGLPSTDGVRPNPHCIASLSAPLARGMILKFHPVLRF